jgi:hypothetical protein
VIKNIGALKRVPFRSKSKAIDYLNGDFAHFLYHLILKNWIFIIIFNYLIIYKLLNINIFVYDRDILVLILENNHGLRGK